MGYNLYITRGSWYDREKPKINQEEWLSLVAADPDLSVETVVETVQSSRTGRDQDEVLVRWLSSDDDPTFIYSYRSGTIRVKSPGDETIRKMINLADKLGAFVQGEENEYYRLGDGGIERYW